MMTACPQGDLFQLVDADPEPSNTEPIPDLAASRAQSADLPTTSQPLTEAIDPTRLWTDDDEETDAMLEERARKHGVVECWACGGSSCDGLFGSRCFACRGTGEVSADELLREREDGPDDDADDEDNSLEACLADAYADEMIDAQDRLTAALM